MNTSDSKTEPKPSAITMYVVYDHPSDYPDLWVVRMWRYYMDKGSEVAVLHAALWARQAETLEAARELIPKGLTNMGRDSEDDPVIYEVWLDETGA